MAFIAARYHPASQCHSVADLNEISGFVKASDAEGAIFAGLERELGTFERSASRVRDGAVTRLVIASEVTLGIFIRR